MIMKFWRVGIFPKVINLKCKIESCRIQFLSIKQKIYFIE